MRPLFQTVTDLGAGADVLKRRAYGVIEAVDGQFRRVRLRPLPKLVSAPDIMLLGRWHHRHAAGDRCLLYYNQPWRFPDFLAVKYIVSSRDTAYVTFRRVLEVLDEIARLKQSDALLCELWNSRISRRMMVRWGWQPHCPSGWHRHYIKRFYGEYPPLAGWIRPIGTAEKGTRFNLCEAPFGPLEAN